MNIVITGATKGIGRAVAEKFASEGFNLALCARNKHDLDAFRKMLKNKYPDTEVIAQPCDVSEKKQLKEFADRVNETWDAVDILMNNAGTFLPGNVHKEKAGTLEKLMKTNMYSAYYLTQYLLKNMMKRKSGHIFNNCSVASMQAYERGGSYGISKHALLGFSRNLRLELMPYQIRVTAIIAGATYTHSWEGVDLPEDRFMKTEDVARAVWSAYTMSQQTVVEEIILRPMKGDI